MPLRHTFWTFVVRKVIQRFNFGIHKPWFITVTSSISISMKVPKKLSPGTIHQWSIKLHFLHEFSVNYVKIQWMKAMIFTESYRKVRKYPGNQKIFARAQFGTSGQNSLFFRSYHSTWSYWGVENIFLFIGWLVTW